MSPLVLMQRAEPGGGEGGHCPLAQRKKKKSKPPDYTFIFYVLPIFFYNFFDISIYMSNFPKKEKRKNNFSILSMFSKIQKL